jgi:uncharacterized protein
MAFTARLSLFLLIALLMKLPSAALAAVEEIRFIRIGTGPIGGTYFPVGGLIANIISGPPGSMPCDIGGSCGVPGLIAAAVSTQGSVENVDALMAGRLDLALCQANIAHDAFTGSGAYAGKPMAALRTIGNLFPEAVHVVARQDRKIETIAQLRGRRVALGERNSGTFVTARMVLRAYGLAPNDLKPVYEKLARSAEMLTTGDIDAFFMVGGQPMAAVAHAADRAEITLLPIRGGDAERIIKAQPFFAITTIPADTYRGVAATETIGVGAQLLVSADRETDLVYAITRALWDPRNRKVLDSGNPNAQRMHAHEAVKGLSVPLHPGAERYYRESGVISAGNP